MKIQTRLFLSLVTMVAMLGGPFGVVLAGESATSADGEMQDALDQLDVLLQSSSDSGAVSEDLLSQLNRLQNEFQRLQKDFAQRDQDGALSETKTQLKKLQDENQILKDEIEKQHRRIEEADAARKQAEKDFERLFKGEGKPPAVDGTKVNDQAVEIERLKEELQAVQNALNEAQSKGEELASPISNDERVRELQAAVEEMKDVDAQRKAAMDDLFKQLSVQKKAVAARDQQLLELQSVLDTEKARVVERDGEIAVRESTIASCQASLASRQQQIDTLTSEIADLHKQKQSTVSTLAVREDKLDAVSAELEQVKLVDAQRRKTLDETLESLATTEKKAKTLTAELEQEKSSYAAYRNETEQKITELSDRIVITEGEISRMEKDVSATMADRDAALSQVASLRETLSERDATVTDLENKVARLSAVDTQRRKAMDQILLETAELGQEKSRLELEVQRLTLAVANNTQSENATTDDMVRLQNENAALQTRVAELEQSLQAARAMPVPGIADTPESDDHVVAAPSTPAQDTDGQQKRNELEMAELAELRESALKDAERLESLTRDLAQAQQNALELQSRVNELASRKNDVRQSDLFKELEEVNSLLREKMLEVEADRQRLAKLAKDSEKTEATQTKTIETQAARLTELDTALTEALAREAEYKELIERLVPQVEQLEQQMTALTQERVDLTNRLLQRDEDLQALKVELERREHRLAKAERVADVLEQARTEVRRAGEREKLNMHYNMASVYAREGKYTEAENEYLQSLRIDPTDADVHYNLGILYDDEMKQPEKAMVHYRRYLQLNPHGPDADNVRTWLMKLEMQAQR